MEIKVSNLTQKQTAHQLGFSDCGYREQINMLCPYSKKTKRMKMSSQDGSVIQQG